MKRFPLVFALPILIAGCASPATYPSLLPRGGERAGFDEPAAPPPVTIVADPALDARIAVLARSAGTSGARFASASEQAERRARAARGATAGSDAWLDAQTALADLDTLRAETLDRLTGLEQLAAERALALAPDYPALETAIAAARATADQQAARIAVLQAMLAPA